MLAKLCDRVLASFISLLHQCRPKTVLDRDLYLSGFFRPVQGEEPLPQKLAVQSGALPAALSGAFVRLALDSHFAPAGQHHLFDSDGLVLSVRFRDGSALACTRYVRTARWLFEQAAQRATQPRIGDMHGVIGVMLIVLSSLRAKLSGTVTMGTANTALILHARRLLALNEGDVPYGLRILCDGAVETLGVARLDPSLKTFTAHPKVDASTGELMYFGYALDAPPYVTYGVLDATGAKVHTTPIPIRKPQMMHDFAIAGGFTLFFDCPLFFDPQAMVSQNSLPFVFDKAAGSRVGVLLRRGNGSDTKWFDLPDGCMIFHSLGAWEAEEGASSEEGGSCDGVPHASSRKNTLVLLACRMERFSLEMPPMGKHREHDPRAIDGGSPVLTRFEFDLSSGACSQRILVPLPPNVSGMDFPRAHPALTGRKLRWGYLALFQGLVICGLAKIDVDKGAISARIDFPGDSTGGEPCFVPRVPGAPSSAAEEDDGWVLTVVSSLHASSIWVVDAKDMAVLAVLPLPCRVSWGTHSTFLTEEELALQKSPDVKAL